MLTARERPSLLPTRKDAGRGGVCATPLLCYHNEIPIKSKRLLLAATSMNTCCVMPAARSTLFLHRQCHPQVDSNIAF